DEDMVRVLQIDSELDLDEVTVDIVNQMSAVGPHGMGNRRPVFVTRNVRIAGDVRELRGGHIKFTVRQDGERRDVIAYRKASWRDQLMRIEKMDLVYSPQINVWLGNTTVQLVLSDWKPSV
ncbi:hypothetical protein ACFL1X_11980, partial [Candidatus Hydrogenedentota bacterium]